MVHLGRIFVGAVVSLLVLVLLYGPTQVGMMLFFAVVCTVGIGLIPILFMCWLVGWLVTAVWQAVVDRNRTPTSPAPPPAGAP